jgi:hypothetical protein
MPLGKTWRVWAGMIERCYYPVMPNDAKHYADRGIKVCDRWRESFENFVQDMGEKPHGLTLDRIDNNGDYEPSNCKWSTPFEQSINRTVTKLKPWDIKRIKVLALTLPQAWIAEALGVKQPMISRIVNGKRWSQVK